MVWSLLLLSLEAAALDATDDIKATSLAKETTGWDGEPIAYPQGQAEMTALLIEIGPGAQTGGTAISFPTLPTCSKERLK